MLERSRPSRTATLIRSFNQPEAQIAPSQGNSQLTANGNTVVGWGSLPYFSEYDSYGDLLYNAKFPTGVHSYRAYFLPWKQGGGHGHGNWDGDPDYEPKYSPDHGDGGGPRG